MMWRSLTPPAIRPDEDTQKYLISVSDLMAGLIFLFIITLMVFALKLKGTQTDLRAEVEKQRQEKKRLESLVNQLTSSKAVRSALLKDIKKTLFLKGFRVHVDLEHGILHLPEEILFPLGSDQLQPRGKKILKVLATVLGEVLPKYIRTADSPIPGVEAIFIEGHTDNIPVRRTSVFRDNWDLSAARAITTYQYLIKANPFLDTIRNRNGQPIFSVAGYADRRPIFPNDSEVNRRRNRRIDIRFIMTPPKATPEVLKAIQRKLNYEVK